MQFWRYIKGFKLKNPTTITVIVCCLITAALVVPYIWTFSKSDISNKPEHWGQFGDYFGMIVSLIGTVAVFGLSYLVYRGQQERDKWERDILELNERPILIFTADNNVYDKCINVGKGAAHNVIIGKVTFNGQKDVFKAYSIPSSGYIQVMWQNNPNELYAYYESINGKKYLVNCKDDVNSQLIDGELDIDGNSHKSIVDWLKQSATRHSGLSLKMLGS